MSNTLLSESMILAKAMWMAHEAAACPCEITADFQFPTSALTLSIDGFTIQHLRPAIADALARKRPLHHRVSFRPLKAPCDVQLCRKQWGVAARLRRRYNVNADVLEALISMRIGVD